MSQHTACSLNIGAALQKVCCVSVPQLVRGYVRHIWVLLLHRTVKVDISVMISCKGKVFPVVVMEYKACCLLVYCLNSAEDMNAFVT